MDLSIIIVNYNTSEHLKKCLESIFQCISKLTFEVIVVDNNSPDRKIEELTSKFPQVNFYFLDSNGGFGSGCNYGASKANGKYLMFVNPDIVFEENTALEMFGFMEGNKNTGACSPVFVNFENELVYTYNKFPDYKWEFFEFLGRGNDKKEKELLDEEKIRLKLREPFYVDWVTGACIMIPKYLFMNLNGFDDDYFLYYEDTDIQKRIRNAGYSIVCLPYLRIKHFVNSSVRSDEGEDIYFYHLNRSKMLYFYKRIGFIKRNLLRCLMISGVLLRMLALSFRNRYKEKREKKMNQYKKILKIYLSTKEQLINS